MTLPGRRLRVLHVEDNRANQRLVERLLTRRPGTSVVTAGTVRSALDLAGREAYDLVLLDLHLPDGHGEQVLAALLAADADRPVVVLSSDAMPATAVRVLEAGARDYLTKPLDLARLSALLDDVAGGAA
jgi:DNA-binding response OmpR family regulator